MNPHFFPFLSMPALQQTSEVGPPARVTVALGFLAQISAKTMQKVAINEHQFEVLDGQKLTTAEANAQATAANLLSDYFHGKLKPDYWEDQGDSHLPSGDKLGVIISCVACGPGQVKQDCYLCQGLGKILVFPTSGGKIIDGHEN